MKKIIASALCAALVVLSFASCAKKADDKTATQTPAGTTDFSAVEFETVEFEIPEEEQDFVVEELFGTTVPSVKIKEYTGEAENLVIPEQLTSPTSGLMCVVAEIGDAAFQGNETLKSVEITKNVVTIGKGAFQSCVNLTNVVIYNGETVTDEEGNVTEIPATLTTIGDNAFHNTALTEINIPATVTAIGFHAFSDKFNETPWYASLTDEKVIVGDGILLKCTYSNAVNAVAAEPEEAEAEEAEAAEGEEAEAPVEAKPANKEEIKYAEFDLTDVKRIAYYAFDNPGAIALNVNENLLAVDRYAVFVPAGTKSLVKFLVPYVKGGCESETILKAGLFEYDLVNAPKNPFHWTFDTAESVETWNGGNGIDVSFGQDGSLYGKSTNTDPIFATTDRLNIPAEVYNKLVIRMKHNISEEKTDGNKSKFHIQVFFRNNATSFSEGASLKVEEIEQTSNGEYIDYTLNLSSNANWTGVINAFRVDVGSCSDSDFWIDSIEFVPVDPEFDFGTLLKPIQPAIPTFENPYKYKFAEQALADAWTTSGMEYSYNSDSETIHGVVTDAAEPTIVSPELSVPGFEYRKLIVRMKHNFAGDEASEEAKTYRMKVYFDNGEGYTEERAKEAEVAETSGDSKVEYTFDMYELDGWYGEVKGIKIVLLDGMNGEFDIDKVEFVPETKLTRGDLITKLYEADGSKSVYGESEFADVVEYDSYYNAVLWATSNALIAAEEIDENEEFIYNPEGLVTAEEAVNLLNAFADYKKSTIEKAVAPADPEVVVYEMDADDRIAAIVALAPVEEMYTPMEYVPESAPKTEAPKTEEVKEESAGLPVGAIIGIVAGALVLVAAAVVVVIFLKKKKGAKK